MTTATQEKHRDDTNQTANLAQGANKKKVLLIDDDISFRALVLAQAESTEIDIVALDSLSRLVKPKNVKEFDAIILDYYLEQLNGLQVAQYINAFFPMTPVVLISAYGIFESQESWPECVKGFWSKDSGVTELLNYTESLMDVYFDGTD